MTKWKVCIDAGHGGSDPGAISRPAGDQEAAINMAVANRMFGLLGRGGKITPVLTRRGLEGVPFSKRVAVGNECSVLVSLHCNSAQSPGGNGVEVWVDDDDKAGMRLAKAILKELLAIRLTLHDRPFKFRDRGVKTGNFYMIREPKVPRCLVEMGFISNECDRLVLVNHQDILAEAIASGVETFLLEEGAG